MSTVYLPIIDSHKELCVTLKPCASEDEAIDVLLDRLISDEKVKPCPGPNCRFCLAAQDDCFISKQTFLMSCNVQRDLKDGYSIDEYPDSYYINKVEVV